MKIHARDPEKVWAEFTELAHPTPEQLDQFQKYTAYLLECNQMFNLTAITDVSGVARNHFLDSLAASTFVDLHKPLTIVDIGSGAGFPGIPLKIMHPSIKLILIEVNKKKQGFLHDIIKILGLTDVTICDLDWRTFLRNTEYQVDYFVTRAALDDLELSRMFRPACRYNQATLLYWASKDWFPHPKVEPLIQKIESYKIAHKERRLVFIANRIKS